MFWITSSFSEGNVNFRLLKISQSLNTSDGITNKQYARRQLSCQIWELSTSYTVFSIKSFLLNRNNDPIISRARISGKKGGAKIACINWSMQWAVTPRAGTTHQRFQRGASRTMVRKMTSFNMMFHTI